MDLYVIHIAMAALAGLYVTSISSDFIHSKALAERLDFAFTVECGRRGVEIVGATKKWMNTRLRKGTFRLARRRHSERGNSLGVANSVAEVVDEHVRDASGRSGICL